MHVRFLILLPVTAIFSHTIFSLLLRESSLSELQPDRNSKLEMIITISFFILFP
ncbi:hypothetical protein P20429_2346 [Pseudoalteromonas sp. BSi20429]|nr:hypothetical protein P20429_2346 [Pseudoalteromonas sp. BSi20429]